MEDPRITAKKLVALAYDDRTPKKERQAARNKAIKLIHEHDLLGSPLDGLIDQETVETFEVGKRFFDGIKKVFDKAQSRRRGG
jgi:hypothetical protein